MLAFEDEICQTTLKFILLFLILLYMYVISLKELIKKVKKKMTVPIYCMLPSSLQNFSWFSAVQITF